MALKSPYVTELWNKTKIQNVGHASEADVADNVLIVRQNIQEVNEFSNGVQARS